MTGLQTEKDSEKIEAENPCLICTVHQQCCSQLSGLWLSEGECERLFRKHANDLDLIKYKKVYIAIAKNHRPCPYWREDGCSIYHERPIDCRLYPYEIMKIDEKKKSVKVLFRANSGCPEKDQLLAPLEVARALIASFCQDVYGEEKRIEMEYSEQTEVHGPLSALVRPLIAFLSRKIRSCK